MTKLQPARCAAEAPAPIEWTAFEAGLVPPDILGVVRATCLLESRSDQYGRYLIRVLPDRWADDVVAWVAEETHHGRALRRWLGLADPEFDVDDALRRFSALPYHEGEAAPRRGGTSGELISRCVVEALASAFYAALGESTDEPLLRQICSRLQADERRHLEMFHEMLTNEPPLALRRRVVAVVRRVRELDDDQIVFAAHCANRSGTYDRRSVRREHFACVWSMYRATTTSLTVDLLLVAVGLDPPPVVRRWLAWGALGYMRCRRVILTLARDGSRFRRGQTLLVNESAGAAA